jgi:hypothetical protein
MLLTVKVLLSLATLGYSAIPGFFDMPPIPLGLGTPAITSFGR